MMKLMPYSIGHFEGPRIKIERADHHIACLETQINAFLASGQIRIVSELQPKTKQEFIVVKQDEPFPRDWPAVLGDAIHNLRSALDIAACDCLRIQGKSFDKIKFPFATDKNALDDALKGEIRRAGAKVVDELRKLEPYAGANNTLRDIHDLDIADKHHLILPVAVAANVRSVVGPGGSGIFGGKLLGIHNVTESLIAMPSRYAIPNRKARRASGWTSPEIKVDVTVEICFGEGKPRHGEEIVSSLKLMKNEATRAVEALAALFS